jgi:hypothetical protein
MQFSKEKGGSNSMAKVSINDKYAEILTILGDLQDAINAN